jgi:hypothetical protein
MITAERSAPLPKILDRPFSEDIVAAGAYLQ